MDVVNETSSNQELAVWRRSRGLVKRKLRVPEQSDNEEIAKVSQITGDVSYDLINMNSIHVFILAHSHQRSIRLPGLLLIDPSSSPSR